MPKRNDSADFHRQANEVRMIAAGIFDKGERDLVLRFVEDCEKRIASHERPDSNQNTLTFNSGH
jgi:hypothetical protein